ncbi:expressed protein [Phakopsora pachyrhizi]|uniref:Histidinol-phosphatase n=1 Tax=Phakopsora pachyrhizi TaxID=170000 RepID=A0AAV0AM49_PHAPC|nr:expressed protein [Phakopsora pachyrhizi]
MFLMCVVVGSVHHVNQIFIDFDLETFNRALCSFKPPRALTSDRCVEAEEEGDDSLRLLCEAYFQAQYDLIDSYRPEVIGHFDLCLLFHPKFDLTQHQSLWNQVERNIRLAISYGALFEVNYASIRKGWSTPYPSKPILSVSFCPFSFFLLLKCSFFIFFNLWGLKNQRCIIIHS